MSKTKFGIITATGLIVALAALSFTFLAGPTLAPSVAQAQEPAQMTPPPRTITVVGEGTTNIEPDLAQANIGVQVTGSEVITVSAQAEEIMNAVIAAIQAEGVAPEDIQTSGFNIFATPPQGFMAADEAGSSDTVYQVSNNVNVTIRNLETVSAILDAAIEAGANNVYGVNFSLADYSQPESDARGEAMTNAQEKAQEIAGLAGVELGDIISVSEVIGGQNGFYSGRLESALGLGGGGPIEPGQLEVRVQLQVVYSIQ
jgi:uncharacterized protein YggE